MKHRLAVWLRSDQAVLVVFGTHCGLTGLFLGWETYVTHKGRFLSPGVWPPLFVAAWIVTGWYHSNRRSRQAWKWSGVLLLGSYLSRAATLAVTAQTESDYSARFAVGVLTWMALAFLVELLWVRIVTPHREADVSQ